MGPVYVVPLTLFFFREPLTSQGLSVHWRMKEQKWEPSWQPITLILLTLRFFLCLSSSFILLLRSCNLCLRINASCPGSCTLCGNHSELEVYALVKTRSEEPSASKNEHTFYDHMPKNPNRKTWPNLTRTIMLDSAYPSPIF